MREACGGPAASGAVGELFVAFAAGCLGSIAPEEALELLELRQPVREQQFGAVLRRLEELTRARAGGAALAKARSGAATPAGRAPAAPHGASFEAAVCEACCGDPAAGASGLFARLSRDEHGRVDLSGAAAALARRDPEAALGQWLRGQPAAGGAEAEPAAPREAAAAGAGGAPAGARARIAELEEALEHERATRLEAERRAAAAADVDRGVATALSRMAELEGSLGAERGARREAEEALEAERAARLEAERRAAAAADVEHSVAAAQSRLVELEGSLSAERSARLDAESRAAAAAGAGRGEADASLAKLSEALKVERAARAEAERKAALAADVQREMVEAEQLLARLEKMLQSEQAARLEAEQKLAAAARVEDGLVQAQATLATLDAALRAERAARLEAERRAGAAGAEVPVPGISAPGGAVAHSGRKRALLVGINYFGTRAELKGCINDVRAIAELLQGTLGWESTSIRTLTDDDRNRMPTRARMEQELRWLVEGAQPGDALFLHYSGHGSQQKDPNGFEEDGMNETILPVDFQSAGMLCDDRLNDFVVKPLPDGVRLTAIMDCCHSGTNLDLPFEYERHGGSEKWKEEPNPLFHASDVHKFSGCDDDQTSADASSRYGQAGGAMTTAFCEVVKQLRGHVSYSDLMDQLTTTMKKRGFSQRPQLTTSQKFPFDRAFSLTDARWNSNPELGRRVRQKFPPKPRPASTAGLLAPLLRDAGLSPWTTDVGG